MTAIKNAFYWTSFFGMISGIFLILYFLYLAFYPFPTVTVKQPLHVITPIIKRGELLRYSVEYCKLTDKEANIIHQLIGDQSLRIDGAGVVISNATLRVEEGCGTLIKGIPIPEFTPPGEYHLEEWVCYDVTPLQKSCMLLVSDHFEVIE